MLRSNENETVSAFHFTPARFKPRLLGASTVDGLIRYIGIAGNIQRMHMVLQATAMTSRVNWRNGVGIA